MPTTILSTEALEWLFDPGEEIIRSRGWIPLKTKSVASSSSEEDVTIDLPYDLSSQHALEFLYFTSATAGNLFAQYVQVQQRLAQITILDAAESHIHASTNAWLESDK